MTALFRALGAGFALLAAACATAPAPDAAAPARQQAGSLTVEVHEGEFARIQQFTTPGGVSVWLVTEPAIPIVSVQMAWRGGRAMDPDDSVGLGNAVTYMMNEGAGDLDALAFQTRMEELNMSFGCSISDEWTGCSASMLSDNAGEAMGLVATAFAAPRFDDGPFERFVREEQVKLNMRETNGPYLAQRAQAQALYPDHPFARETTADTLARLTPDLARAHMRRLMTRDRLIVTAVGNVTPDELAPLIDGVAAGLPETGSLEPVAPISLPAAAAPAPIVIPLPQPQSLVQFIGPGLTRDHPDFFAALVLNYIFGGGGFESRLMKTLRVEKGLTYGISTGLDPSPSFASWNGGGQTKNESAGEFVAGIRDEMHKLMTGGVTEQELADAKAYLTGSYPLGFDSNAKIAGQMMIVRRENLGVDYFDRRNAQIDAVTLADVNRVAAAYLAPERFSMIIVGEPQGLK